MSLAPCLTTAKSPLKTDYGTPVAIYEMLNSLFTFTVDLAAHAGNYKHRRYYSVKENSLAQDWGGETGFLNPPYGRGISGWLDKARDSAIHDRAIVCQLLPARVGTAWWRKFVMCGDGAAGSLRQSFWVPETEVLWLKWEALTTGIHFPRQRIDFEGAPDGAPFDAAFVWHASPTRNVPASAKMRNLLWRWPR